MAELLPVPEVAAGATEVVLAEWLVAPGEEFKAGDPIAVIETDKAVVEIEAEKGAALLRPLVAPGARVEVGAPMALLGTTAEAGGDLDAMLAALGVGAAPAAGPAPVPEPVGSASSVPPARIFISPIARKLLAEAGIAPEEVSGTGPRGRIRRRDVDVAIAARASVTEADAELDAELDAGPPASPVVERTVAGGWTEVPHTRLRLAVARRLTASKQEVPHFYVKRSARMDALVALRAELNRVAPTRISVNDFVLRAVAVAHTDVPDANVTWAPEAMRRYSTVDVSVAIASARGLVTPVLRGVESSSLSAISAQVRAYAEQADAGRLQQRDLEGGSISVSNLGMYGVDEFSAIINPPQSAILAVGAGRQVPVVADGAVEVATMVDLVLSVDHRAIDGALAAQWMAALVAALEDPFRLVV